MQHAPRFLRLCEAARSRIKEMTGDEFLARRADKSKPAVELIDVREDHEWQVSRLPGARHMGRGILERDIERVIPDLDAPIVLYCGGGFRSALAAESLELMGYRNVYSLAGGFRNWRESGRELDSAPVPPGMESHP